MSSAAGQVSAQAVFIDAGAYIALTVRKDGRHDDAEAVYGRLSDERWRPYTIVPILAEACVLIRRTGIEPALTFLADIYDSQATTIETVRHQDEHRARGILAQYGDKDFSFADALAFAVCERLKIRQAFSFDQHFRQYGHLHVIDSVDLW